MSITSLPSFNTPLERSAWVQAALRMRGLSFAAIARANGWHANSVSNAMYTPSDPQEKAIAEALEVGQQELFPERYSADGRRLHLTRTITAGPASRNVKADAAA